MSIKKIINTFTDGFNGEKIKEKIKSKGKEIEDDIIYGRAMHSRIYDGFKSTWENTEYQDWYNAAQEATDFYDDFMRGHYRQRKNNNKG